MPPALMARLVLLFGCSLRSLYMPNGPRSGHRSRIEKKIGLWRRFAKASSYSVDEKNSALNDFPTAITAGDRKMRRPRVEGKPRCVADLGPRGPARWHGSR